MLSRRFLLLTTVLGLFAVLLTPLAASAFAPKPPPLATPWTNQVSVTDPLPEYPRPQLTRPEWQSLNGVWQFAPASDLNTPPVDQDAAPRRSWSRTRSSPRSPASSATRTGCTTGARSPSRPAGPDATYNSTSAP